jgi:GxxExxY protein
MIPRPRMRLDDLPGHVNEITGDVVDAALAVHREMGPGLLESVYHDAMCAELTARGRQVGTKVSVEIRYKGAIVGNPLQLDLLVDNQVIVEIKAVETLHAVHWAQLLTYLRLARKPVGLLINFNEFALKDGIRRVIPPMLS